MDELEQKIALAKTDRTELDHLLTEYLPFIKAQAASLPGIKMEYADRLSISMMVFTNCVYQYSLDKGLFLSFARVCIRNRLIDEERKFRNQISCISLDEPEADPDWTDPTIPVSLQTYSQEQEHEELCGEIAALSAELEPYHITLTELPKICPRRRQSRLQCSQLAQYCIRQPDLKNKLKAQQRLPQQELSQAFHISVKTVEKHRKYIITLAVVLMGDYPSIRAYLPIEEVRQ